jgi:hypothetical protein
MTRPSRGLAVALAAALIIALATVTVAVATGLGGPAAPVPTPSAAPSPTGAPTPRPTEPSTPAPSAEPDGDLTVDLDVADPHDVSMHIDDRTGQVTGASSGRAGDGMSVRWGVVDVQNVDADTLRITWVGLPGDAELQALVFEERGQLRFVIAQAAPPANSDALGFDRVLILDFAESISAADVNASMQEGFDTPG